MRPILLQPRSSADFAILHKELAAWWRQETAKIKSADADEEAKQEALQMLLAKVRAEGVVQGRVLAFVAPRMGVLRQHCWPWHALCLSNGCIVRGFKTTVTVRVTVYCQQPYAPRRKPGCYRPLTS